MERDQNRRRGRTIDAPRRILSITDGMLQIRRLHNRADVLEIEGKPEGVRRLHLEALRVAVRVVRLAAENGDSKQELDTAMQGLKGSDWDMHRKIENILEQAQAVRATSKAINI